MVIYAGEVGKGDVESKGRVFKTTDFFESDVYLRLPPLVFDYLICRMEIDRTPSSFLPKSTTNDTRCKKTGGVRPPTVSLSLSSAFDRALISERRCEHRH